MGFKNKTDIKTKKKIIEYFVVAKDNRMSVISKLFNIPESRASTIINEYLNKKQNANSNF